MDIVKPQPLKAEASGLKRVSYFAAVAIAPPPRQVLTINKAIAGTTAVIASHIPWVLVFLSLRFVSFRFFFQLVSVNDGRLRRLSKSGGIAEKDANPWARCRGPGGGAAAGRQGVRLRNYIRRLQLEKTVSDSQVREV